MYVLGATLCQCICKNLQEAREKYPLLHNGINNIFDRFPSVNVNQSQENKMNNDSEEKSKKLDLISNRECLIWHKRICFPQEVVNNLELKNSSKNWQACPTRIHPNDWKYIVHAIHQCGLKVRNVLDIKKWNYQGPRWIGVTGSFVFYFYFIFIFISVGIR